MSEPQQDRYGRTPPRPQLVLRVGVTGHRPNRLAGADLAVLRSTVAGALELIARVANDAHADAASVYAPGGPLLRVISPLAEGSDRIVAREGLARGFELQCVLPFARGEYARDFSGLGSESSESLQEYDALLRQATAILELDGSRETPQSEAEAYEAAGRTVLDQCDVLIAIWDGQEPRGVGGTAHIVDAAIRLGIPVVWIPAQPPHSAHLLLGDRVGRRTDQALGELATQILGLLRPPRGEPGEVSDREADTLAAYLAERQPRCTTLGWAWGTFTALLVDLRFRPPKARVADFETAAKAEWEREWPICPGLPVRVTQQINYALQQYFAWADGLAVYYANVYRSSFILNYSLGVIAVLLELIVDVSGWLGRNELLIRMMRLAALAAVLALFAIWSRASRRRWHERWVDCRLLAELLRQLRFLSPLGRTPVYSHLPAHSAYGSPRNSWLNWYYRAVVREAGIVNACFSQPYLEATRLLLRDGLVKAQIEYHSRNACRLEALDNRLRWMGIGTFLVALCFLGLLVFKDFTWLALFAAIAPVLGGALAAIRSQGELERFVKRSRAMVRQLSATSTDLSELDPSPSSLTLTQVAEVAAESMIDEVLDWRVVFRDRPLELAG